MEIISILRVLRRHRVLVLLGSVPALLAGLMLVYQVSFLPPQLGSRSTATGVASARVLLDAREQKTPRLSLALNDTLGIRALVLADLLATDASREAIARGAGLQADEVAVFGPSTGAPPVAIPLATRATEAAALSPEPYRLTAATDGLVPIIVLRVTGADAPTAVRLVDAATAALGDVLEGSSGGRSTLLLEPLGPAVGATRVEGPKPPLAALGAMVAFLFWCAAIVLVVGVVGHWRRRHAPRGAARLPLPG